MPIRLSFGPRRNNSAMRAALGGVVCLGLSIVGFAVVISGEPISGGIPFVAHYMWSNLAAAQGSELARDNLKIAERSMTREQIAEAQRRSTAFRPTPE